ncbi:LIM domain-binding protein 2-like protein [Leptotrombidium deliense]|uniref:LIM domain-binding protein 2-like protein n=1 Tax=Leptotrombidium deliense TaxID=299467 RepID=A0A443S4W2_9ACAR|nr:LIM domain-binding protein 2-like protein [Leptotrombidium deliense]
MFNQCISSIGQGPVQCPPSGPPPSQDPLYGSPFSSYFRRHTPYFGSPDFRIYEINKRLQQRTEESDNLWWDAFATEFFEDDATLTLTFCLEDGPKRYTIGRTLIPRYFRSIFEGGVNDLSFHLKHPKESFHNTSITLDCEQCSMITHHGKPNFSKVMGSGPYSSPNDPPMKDQMQMNSKDSSVVVCTEGRLILEFTFDDLMRIKSWHFATRQHQELIPRGLIALQAQQDPSMLEQMSKNITRQGLTNSTLNYLRLCVILEPMQELMSRHKAYALSPRDCLKTTLFQKWQRMVAPPETQRPPTKRRKRKSSATSGGNTGMTTTGKKKNNNAMSPGPPNFTLASQDVMVVGEPSLMGGEFGDEDERLITRLENTQYDPSASGAANGLEDSDEFASLGSSGGAPGSASSQGPGNVPAGPPASWSGPSGVPTTTSGSVPPPSDSRSGSSGGSAPPGSQEDKKPSPLSQ